MSNADALADAQARLNAINAAEAERVERAKSLALNKSNATRLAALPEDMRGLATCTIPELLAEQLGLLEDLAAANGANR